MKMQNTVKELVLTSSQFSKGIRACITLDSVSLHYCGYVRLPEEVAAEVDSMSDLDAHGGITYDELIDGFRVVGFDCAHYGDYTLYKHAWSSRMTSHHMLPVPEFVKYSGISAMHFRTQTYVIQELRRLVASLDEFQIRKSRS